MEKFKEKTVLVKAFLVLLMIIYIFAICPVSLQNDTLFDIKCGENFLKNGVGDIDHFSVHEGLKYQSHHFVSSIWIYIIYNNFGFLGIYLFEVFLTCIIVMLMYKLNVLVTKNKLFSYFLLYFEVFALSPFISVRAQMFSTILFLAQLIFLTALKDSSSSKINRGFMYVCLTLIPMVIMNVHSGVYLFYYIIMGVYFLSCCIEKNNKFATNILITSIISAPLMLLNVYKLDGLTYVFKTFGNDFMERYVAEFQALSIKGGATSIIFICAIIAILIFLIFSKRRKNVHEILLFLGTAFMSMISIRHFIFFAICIPVFSENIYEIYNKFFNKNKIKNNITKKLIIFELIVVYILVVIAFFCSKSYEPLGEERLYPDVALDYIKENIGYDARILNAYNYGSYMMFNDIKVFIDARADLYTEEYNNVTIAKDVQSFINCEKYYMDIIEKYDIEYIFILRDSNVVDFLRHDSKMEVLFENEEENSIVIKVNK